MMSEIAVKSHANAITKEWLTEDWVSVAIGVLVFALSLFSLSGVDLLGWAVTTSIYTDVGQALKPFATGFAWLSGGTSLLATYFALVVVLSIGVAALGGHVAKFALAFTVTFGVAYASW